MLLQDGELQYIGDPEDTALRYYRLNFAGSPEVEAARARPEADRPIAEAEINGRLVHAHLLDEQGKPIENVEQGVPLRLDIVLEAARELERPVFVLQVLNVDGDVVFGIERHVERDAGRGPDDPPGRRDRQRARAGPLHA